MKDIKTFIEMFRQLNFILNAKQKRNAVKIFIFILISACFELLGVAVLLPFIQVVVDPDALLEISYLQPIIEILHIKTSTDIVVAICVFIVIVYVAKNSFLSFSIYEQTHFQNQLKNELGVRMLTSYMSRPYIYFVKTNSAIVLRGVDNDVQGVYVIVQNLMLLMKELLTTIFIVIFLCYTDFYITLGIMLFAGTCFLVTTVKFKRILGRLGQEYRKAQVGHTTALYQAVNGIKEIKVANREEAFINKFKEAAEKQALMTNKRDFISALPDRIIETGCVAALMLVIAIKVLVSDDWGNFALNLGVFAAGAVRILPLISGVVYRINSLTFYRTTLESAYQDIIEANYYQIRMEKYKHERESVSCLNVSDLHFENILKINNIFWKYDEGLKPVLKDMSLDISKGEAIGIIGSSGAGKTTLVDNILGLLQPQDGTIEMDGIDVYTILPQWMKIISYVPQTVFLIDDTIRSNVAFGINTSDISDDLVWAALERAQLKDFVKNLPLGLDTIVGERGIKFSGGQRQRVAIARALYYNPDILVLDEATSALDNETEKAFMESIEMLKGRITLIIVAHRLSTIENCDKIYEIIDGKAIERDRCEVLKKEGLA